MQTLFAPIIAFSTETSNSIGIGKRKSNVTMIFVPKPRSIQWNHREPYIRSTENKKKKEKKNYTQTTTVKEANEPESSGKKHTIRCKAGGMAKSVFSSFVSFQFGLARSLRRVDFGFGVCVCVCKHTATTTTIITTHATQTRTQRT